MSTTVVFSKIASFRHVAILDDGSEVVIPENLDITAEDVVIRQPDGSNPVFFAPITAPSAPA